MAGFTVKIGVAGVLRVRARFARKKARKAVSAALQQLLKGALLVEGRAKRRCPVDMGRLRASITHSGLLPRGDALVVHVGTNAAYARFVEFGTGPAGRRSKLTATARAAMKELGYEHGARGGFPPLSLIGKWAERRGITKGMEPIDAEGLAFHIARSIHMKGTPAKPFLFPAFEESREQIERMLAGAVRAEVEG